jgi:tRNA/tmRNA/rRNA uracil-C5-methylase (TrmA/RlmC/RlmD family)
MSKRMVSSPDLAGGAVIELMVERPAVGGRMIARHDGRIVLVGGAIPGERIRAAVERSRGGVVLARTVEVLEPSLDRRPVTGVPACGGRSFAHIAYRRQVDLKAEIVRDAFRRIGRIELSVPPRVTPSPETGYRMRARLHIGDGRLGFLEERSHRVCDLAGTGQLLPKTERLVGELAAHVGALAATGARAVELAEDLAGDQRALHVVVRGDPAAVADTLRPMASLSGVTGLTAASGTRQGAELVLAGTPYVTDTLSAFLVSDGGGTLSLRRRATSFFQANRYLVPELVAAVASLTHRDQVVDLYAGVGLFAVSIAATRGGRVTAVERDPRSAGDLVSNTAPLDPDVQVVRAPVEVFLKRSTGLEGAAVIVDPPRAGLSREVVTRLARRRPDRIVYVSCDVATQARDLRALLESGYRIDEVQAFDMFPNTPHIETVVSLERS